jgi:hypothetical protein
MEAFDMGQKAKHHMTRDHPVNDAIAQIYF